jgi:hypothetical protein
LIEAFRRHHARRRMLRRTALAAAVCLVLLPASLWLATRHPREQTAVNPVEPAFAPPPAKIPVVQAAAPSSRGARIERFHPAAAARRTTPAAGTDFVLLSSYDLPVRGEELRIIRLEVTGNALRRIGAPVMEQKENRSVLADFVVGQDGTPYAVRLVRSTYSQ